MKRHLDSYFTTRMKRELILLQNANDDPFLLNLEKIYETESHLYIIFEAGELIIAPGSTDLIQNGVAQLTNKFRDNIVMQKGKPWVRSISTSVLASLLKINQYGMCATSLRESIIVKTANGCIKLFNFNHLTKYNDKINKKAWSIDPTWSDIPEGTTFDNTDCWTLGVMIM
jgi:hypothetical protein